jgi:hypothetical protein
VRFVINNVALGQVFLPVLGFSPVSIIPPMLHTHSFIYHRCCIMFLSQYFSFPCQYHSTTAPYSFIHLPPTLYNVSLPVLQFPLSVSFHQRSILVFMYILLLPGQMGKVGHLSKSNAPSEAIRDHSREVGC